MRTLVRVYYLGSWVYASRALAAELRALEAAARAVPPPAYEEDAK